MPAIVSDALKFRFGADVKAAGEAILHEGAGGGWYALPWILGKYERVLDLKPAESWLLTRMLKHAWNSETLVYISFRKVAREAKITQKTVSKLARGLMRKGYIKQEPSTARIHIDPRNRYFVNGIYNALMVCTVFDPHSKFNELGASRNSDAHLVLRCWAYDEFPCLQWELLERDVGDTTCDLDNPEDSALATAVERIMGPELLRKCSLIWVERKGYNVSPPVMLEPVQVDNPGSREFPHNNGGEVKTTEGVRKNYLGVGKNYPTLSRYN